LDSDSRLGRPWNTTPTGYSGGDIGQGARQSGSLGGKRVLITGAAGSIGRALAAGLSSDFQCQALILFDHHDHGLLEIAEACAASAPDTQIVEVLGDIRDQSRLMRVMDRERPDIVIHAAALKHVHVGERHPGECVRTNLIGVRNVVAVAEQAEVQSFTLVSSDKAAEPVCVMGACKRLAELYLGGRSIAGARMRMRSVRFGNVLGSSGSVLPRFEAQIAAGGPVEITHPDMERFFMSHDEAVDLVLAASALDSDCISRGGAYYVDMGPARSIVELAQELIRRSGRDVEIRYTGARAGEKMSERLFDDHESVSPTPIEGLFYASPRVESACLSDAELDEIERVTRHLDDAALAHHLFALLDRKLERSARLAG
jgi:FlaA1/EpsC-like NDP-sugar epimerase